MYRLNWDGRSVGEVINQSSIIHPDWTPEFHKEYLLFETAFELTDLALDANGRPNEADIPAEQCKLPPGCPHERMPGHQLCLHHHVQLTRLLAER